MCGKVGPEGWSRKSWVSTLFLRYHCGLQVTLAECLLVFLHTLCHFSDHNIPKEHTWPVRMKIGLLVLSQDPQTSFWTTSGRPRERERGKRSNIPKFLPAAQKVGVFDMFLCIFVGLKGDFFKNRRLQRLKIFFVGGCAPPPKKMG